MIDPKMWASVPFRNKTALYDFAGQHALWHAALADQVFAVTGNTYRTYPIGTPGGPEWLEAIQQQYKAAATALGLPAPPDLASYDLARAEDHASYFWVLSQTAAQLRTAAGLA